ncbi:hypothetical protein N9333_01075 [Gammaproteobacteria bacterium]|nr:hypothetical protein [Gammaproteobacteria bacterium]
MAEIIEFIVGILAIWMVGAFGVMGCIMVVTFITYNANDEEDVFNAGADVVKNLNGKYVHIAAFILGLLIVNATGIPI